MSMSFDSMHVWRIYTNQSPEKLTGHRIFKLLRLIERLKSWAREIYWPWLKMEILDPLMPKEN